MDEEAEEGYKDTKVQGNEHTTEEFKSEMPVGHLNGDNPKSVLVDGFGSQKKSQGLRERCGSHWNLSNIALEECVMEEEKNKSGTQGNAMNFIREERKRTTERQ